MIRSILRTLFYLSVPALLTVFLAACGGTSAPTAEKQTISEQSPPISNVVVFLGDSITADWPIDQYDPSPTVNVGISGNTTTQMLARFKNDVLAASPGVVVILGGINDLMINGQATTDNIKAMASMASAAGIRVILCSVMPTDYTYMGKGVTLPQIEAFNSALMSLAQENGYLYADYYDEFLTAAGLTNDALLKDGLHPNDAGYAVMWKVISPLITEDLQ